MGGDPFSLVAVELALSLFPAPQLEIYVLFSYCLGTTHCPTSVLIITGLCLFVSLVSFAFVANHLFYPETFIWFVTAQFQG